jgi:hypothetical protein
VSVGNACFSFSSVEVKAVVGGNGTLLAREIKVRE